MDINEIKSLVDNIVKLFLDTAKEEESKVKPVLLQFASETERRVGALALRRLNGEIDASFFNKMFSEEIEIAKQQVLAVQHIAQEIGEERLRNMLQLLTAGIIGLLTTLA